MTSESIPEPLHAFGPGMHPPPALLVQEGSRRRQRGLGVLDLPPFARGANLISEQIQEHEMGKGDRKTAKGKRYNSSYGNARSQATAKAAGTPAAPVKKTATKTTATKAPAKKAVVKKAAAKE